MEKNKSTNALLFIMGMLLVVAIVPSALNLPKNPVVSTAYLISLGFTALYGFWFYKKPHGNMLKYAMLIFAAATIISGCITIASKGALRYSVYRILASTAVCYCAGRLNRIDQNKYLLPIIGLVFLITSICMVADHVLDQTVTFALVIRLFSSSMNYFTLMIAYFTRYKEHKEAGLIDSPKNCG